jgi:LPXTG-site transpeptidase (sortase) family protein
VQSKISLKWAFFIVGIVGISFFLIVIFFARDAQTTAQNLSVSMSAESERSIPIRLKIPKINVDAAIEHVGLTPDGSMGVPKGPSDVGWFDLGPRPGEKGSAVIAGHEGWKDGIKAVFDDLHNLVKGDKIYVEDETGTTTIFVVRELRIYGQNDDASDVFSSIDGKAHLNLITCEGVWNKAEKSYANRLVVFAYKE